MAPTVYCVARCGGLETHNGLKTKSTIATLENVFAVGGSICNIRELLSIVPGALTDHGAGSVIGVGLNTKQTLLR